MSKLAGRICLAVFALVIVAPGTGAASQSWTALTYYLHYESASTDCVGDVYLDLENYPDPGHRCSALDQQIEPTTWEPETFAPVTLDTSRQAVANMTVTGAAFESAALKLRLYGVRNDGQKLLIGRAASSEFTSERPEITVPQPQIPDIQTETYQVNMSFSIRPIAKNAVFSTVTLETDLTGFAPGAYIELDNPASSFTIPTIEQSTTTRTAPCPIPQPTPPS